MAMPGTSSTAWEKPSPGKIRMSAGCLHGVPAMSVKLMPLALIPVVMSGSSSRYRSGSGM